MQPNLPDGAQEKIQEAKQLKEKLEAINGELREVNQKLDDARDARSLLENVPESTTVHRQVDDLLFELDYKQAKDHMDEKVANLEGSQSGLEGQQEALAKEFESIQSEVESMVDQQEQHGHTHDEEE